MGTTIPTLHLQLLLIVLLLFRCFPSLSHGAGTIAVYWGQSDDGSEGTLKDVCSTGNYAFVNIAFLNQFGQGRTPGLNLAAHCDPSSGTCARYTDDINSCQSQGVKVLLSIGGATGPYGLSGDDDATSVADYIYNNFLGGSSDNRPLGSAVLDGVDFDIESGGPTGWRSLAAQLSARSTAERKVYLSAAPQCPFRDANLDDAIQSGLFDYVWVQFYNNPGCQYNRDTGDTSSILSSWNTWASNLPSKSMLFLGLPASTQAAPSGGYIPSSALTGQVLPTIKNSPNYGGVMLWNRFYDITNTDGVYSSAIVGSV